MDEQAKLTSSNAARMEPRTNDPKSCPNASVTIGQKIQKRKSANFNYWKRWDGLVPSMVRRDQNDPRR